MDGMNIVRHLEAAGFTPIYDPTASVSGIDFYAKRKRRVAVVGKAINPNDAPDQWFESIKNVMQNSLPLADTVIFSGGGSVIIPIWFRDWCAQNGIEILVVNRGDPVPEIIKRRKK